MKFLRDPYLNGTTVPFDSKERKAGILLICINNYYCNNIVLPNFNDCFICISQFMIILIYHPTLTSLLTNLNGTFLTHCVVITGGYKLENLLDPCLSKCMSKTRSKYSNRTVSNLTVLLEYIGIFLGYADKQEFIALHKCSAYCASIVFAPIMLTVMPA